MAERKLPPKIKIYEALWAVADERIQLEWFFSNEAKCYSSSGGKFYTVKYDPDKRAIMMNDNGSYWNDYLGYPGIAFLMLKWVILYESEYAFMLKRIARKDINQKFKNDFDKTIEYILQWLTATWADVAALGRGVDDIYDQIESLHMKVLWPKIKPPTWY